MHEVAHISPTIIVIAVLLFFGLGIAIVIIMDHKSNLPAGYQHDLFSIAGKRRDHPVESFVTTVILFGVIVALLFSLFAVLADKLGISKVKEEPAILEKLREERTTERLRHFHNAPLVNKVLLGKKHICFSCHGDFPHSKEPMIRTLMNMHTQFIGCMTCHNDPRKIKESTLSFEWLNYSGIEVKGKPFGTSKNEKTGYLSTTDDYYSKIVAYTNQDNEKKLLEITEDTKEAKEFIAIRDRLTDIDKEAIKKSFHKIVMPKGRFCSRCHTEEKKSYLPFRALGFSDRRISDVTNLNIIGLVEKYKTFYMPKLLKSGKSLPSIKVLIGSDTNTRPDAKQNSTSDKMRKDPRAWWKEQYDKKK